MLSEERFRVSGVDLNTAVGPSNGPPLVFFHGVLRRWQTFTPLIAGLSTRWRLLMPDFRGHGKSARADLYHVSDYVAEAVAWTKRLDEPVVLYGHSLGAMVAAGVAAAIPDRVQAAVLEDPPFHTMGDRFDGSWLLHFFQGMQPFAGDQRPVAQIAHELANLQLIDPGTGEPMRLGDFRDGATLRFMAASLQQVDPKVMTPIVECQWLTGYDVESVFRNLQCPTLVLQADCNAGGMLTDDDAAQMKASAAQATCVKMPGVGHLMHWAQTQQVLNLTYGFLDSL